MDSTAAKPQVAQIPRLATTRATPCGALGCTLEVIHLTCKAAGIVGFVPGAEVAQTKLDLWALNRDVFVCSVLWRRFW